MIRASFIRVVVSRGVMIRRTISSMEKAARSVLGLDHSASVITPKQLRSAYLHAAMSSHPDLQTSKDGNAFRKVTEAYEFLQSGAAPDKDLGITPSEEESFRQSCQDWLGVSAEVVEESKKCPIFRQWLEEKTHTAHRWRLFFALHGGMAPMIRPPAALLDDANSKAGVSRRRRR